MKKTILSLVTLFAVILAGCSSTQDLVEEAAYQYSFAMANYDIDNAEPYADDETQQTTLKTGRGLLSMVDSNYIKSDTPAKIEILNTEMTSDTSAIVTYHKTTPIKDFTGTVEVRMIDGKWLVHSPTPVRKEVLPSSVEKTLSRPNFSRDSASTK